MAFCNLRRKGHESLDLSSSPERPTLTIQRKAKAGVEKKVAKRTKCEQIDKAVVREARIIGSSETDAVTASAPDCGEKDQTASKVAARSRKLVCERLAEALGGGIDKANLATEIEEALHQQLGEEKEYLRQARAILFNLKATDDGSLKHKLLEGHCDPKQLPRMTADELLSDSKSSEKAAAQQKAIQAAMIKLDAQCETDMFTCESCSATRTAHTQTTEMRHHGAEQKIHVVSHVTCLTCGFTWTTR